MSDLSMWLSNTDGELERVTNRLKNLVMFQNLENSHAQMNEMYKGSENPIIGCQAISNDTIRIRVLDVPGFFSENIGGAGGQTLGDFFRSAHYAGDFAISGCTTHEYRANRLFYSTQHLDDGTPANVALLWEIDL